MNDVLNNLKIVSNSFLIVLLILCSIACQKIEIAEPTKAQETEQQKVQENEQLKVLKKFWAAAEKGDVAESAKFTTKTPNDYVLNWDPCNEPNPNSPPVFPPNSNAKYIFTVNVPYRGLREATSDINKEEVEEFTKEISSEDYKILEILQQKEEGKEAVVRISYEFMGIPLYAENATNEEIYKAIAADERRKQEEAKNKGKSKKNTNKSAADLKKMKRIIKEMDFVMYKEADGWKIFDVSPDYKITNKYFAMKMPCEVKE